MNTEDKVEFAKILGVMLDVYGKAVSADVIGVWWVAMDGLTLDQFREAASRHVKTSRFAPTPAEIRDLAGVNASLFPGPEEAWSLAPKDEAESAWVFPQMLAALSVAQDALDVGDRIAARMAFIEAYKRVTANATGAPAWRISLGNADTQVEREQRRLELMEDCPDRCTAAQLAHQRDRVALLTGPAGAPSTKALAMLADAKRRLVQ